jgi:hypothetical protein
LSGALLFCWFFKGCFGKNDVLGWCFCGQSVVDCVVIVTWKLRFVGGGNFAVFENISVEKKPASSEAGF